MSSSRTAPTSTTSSSTSSPSPTDSPQGGSILAGYGHGHSHHLAVDHGGNQPKASVAIIACGAISQPCKEIIDRRGWDVDVHPLPPLLHNRPDLIAGEVELLAEGLREEYAKVAVAYADCGTYGALDEVCERLSLRRLSGLHCYDVYAGAERLQRFFEDQPGTYVFTDFLVRSFARSVIVELGLDRYPELLDTYFGNYTRVVWLAQHPDDELESLARRAADAIGLPLTRLDVGTSGLERELESLLDASH